MVGKLGLFLMCLVLVGCAEEKEFDPNAIGEGDTNYTYSHYIGTIKAGESATVAYTIPMTDFDEIVPPTKPDSVVWSNSLSWNLRLLNRAQVDTLIGALMGAWDLSSGWRDSVLIAWAQAQVPPCPELKAKARHDHTLTKCNGSQLRLPEGALYGAIIEERQDGWWIQLRSGRMFCVQENPLPFLD